MPDSLCKCPLLEMAAEQERMAQAGIIQSADNHAMNNRVNAILVGSLRQRYGCTGPKNQFNHICRYYYETHNLALDTDPNVPLLKRPIKDGQDKKYI